MRSNTDRILDIIDAAVAGSAPFLPVRLVVFPEFAHAAPVFPTVQELLQKLTVPIPNEHTERLTQKAREHNLYIQSGSMLEEDPRWPGAVFNTTCLIGPGRHPVQVPEGQSLDPLRGAQQPARSSRLRRAPVSGRRDPDRTHRLRDLLRLAVSGGHPSTGGERRRAAVARVRLYGPVGLDRADELVVAHQPCARAREHRLRRGRESGRQPAALSAVLVAGRVAGRGLRRPAPCGRIARARRADCCRAGRHVGAPSRTADAGSGTTCWRTCGPRPIPCIDDTPIRSESNTTWRCRTKRASGGSRLRSRPSSEGEINRCSIRPWRAMKSVVKWM